MEQPSDLLAAGHIVLDVRAPDFDACLERMAAALAEARALDAAQIRALSTALHERERLGATAIGRGVAVPHAYAAGIPRTMLLFARLAHAVPHEAPDGAPVDLVLLLAGPAEAQSGHLPLLAHLVRLLHDPRLLEALRRASGPAAVLEALRQAERLHG
jgi:mannitol/fructose-specific phosphotransferase system IIA component (Ntr-type)